MSTLREDMPPADHQITMRIPSLLNWTVLCLNVLLIMFIVFTSPRLLQVVQRNAVPMRERQEMSEFGMQVYCAREPFALFVPEAFPDDQSFVLLHLGRFLSFSEQDRGASSREIDMDVGSAFSISCEYSFVGNECHVEEWTLHQKINGVRQTLSDMNADGLFDKRTNAEEGVSIRYNGGWQQVMDGRRNPEQNRFTKRLMGGERVSFDKTSGQWIPVAKADRP